jgi:hypothetical protein
MIDKNLIDKIVRNNKNWLNITDSGLRSPTQYFPVITQDNLRDGYLYRYFSKIANQNSVVEINKYDYDQLKDNPRFVTAKVKWKIVGPIETTKTFSGAINYGVRELNRRAIEREDLTFGGLKGYIRDYIQYWVGESI